TARYFLLNGNAGNSFAEQYSSGYPEGCAMSCFAMDLADLVFHLCMRACSQMTTPIAYVDNIELMESAVDLEATTVYGKRHRITGALDRLSSIKPLWDLLKHLPDAEWKKLQIRQQCIWANWFKCGATSWRSTRNPNQRPFGTSIKVFTLVGWSVEVPGFYDHYGFWVSFLDTTDGILRSLAEDAWGQYLAHEVTNRKDFSDCSPLISWLLDVYSEDWNKEWAAYKLSLEHPAIVERRTLDPKLTRVDLFTDGSLRQNDDKAELQALTSLVRWLYGVIAPMLQLDSINFYKIGMTFQKMLKMDCGSRCQLSPLAQHIAAHQLGWIEEDPVDAWPAEWNDGADQEGSRGSPFLRGPLFLVGRERLLAEHHGMCQQLTQLQKLHLDISEFRLR
ncbi:unnamed protein product, partial [Cladocopium goreaui]